MPTSKQVQVRSLCVGQPLLTDLTDSAGVLLLRAGVVITQGFIDTLTRRGIRTVATRETEEDRLAREAAEALAESAPHTKPPMSSTVLKTSSTNSNNLDAARADGTFATELTYQPDRSPARKLTVSQLNAMSAETQRAFDQALDQYDRLGPALAAGQLADLSPASELLRGFQRYIAADPALVLLLLRMRHDSHANLYRQGFRTALLSMTLATQMGLSDGQVADAGVAALVHDLGMLKVPEHIRSARRRLTPIEWQFVREHPTHTLNLLDKLDGVSDSVKTAAYQVHERCDASGYPKQRSAQFIHPLAKIIGVADTYAALTDTRAHRRPTIGHEAIKTILREVQRGQHDRSVARALLDTMSMYPVGTHVRLSDGRPARVLRGVPNCPLQPVVVVLENGQPADWELDLVQVGDLTITQVLPEKAAIAA